MVELAVIAMSPILPRRSPGLSSWDECNPTAVGADAVLAGELYCALIASPPRLP